MRFKLTERELRDRQQNAVKTEQKNRLQKLKEDAFLQLKNKVYVDAERKFAQYLLVDEKDADVWLGYARAVTQDYRDINRRNRSAAEEMIRYAALYGKKEHYTESREAYGKVVKNIQQDLEDQMYKDRESIAIGNGKNPQKAYKSMGRKNGLKIVGIFAVLCVILSILIGIMSQYKDTFLLIIVFIVLASLVVAVLMLVVPLKLLKESQRTQINIDLQNYYNIKQNLDKYHDNLMSNEKAFQKNRELIDTFNRKYSS